MKKISSFLCAWEPPPPQNAGERFYRGNPQKVENNTPKVFSPQFNFGNVSPKNSLKDGPAVVKLPAIGEVFGGK